MFAAAKNPAGKSRAAKESPATKDKKGKQGKGQKPKPDFSRSMRETIESIAIAFVLAFLFRSFVLEAFVIPTGSMASTLMGRHKDVICPECGYRCRSGDSNDQAEMRRQEYLTGRDAQTGRPLSPNEREQRRRAVEDSKAAAAICPMCRYTILTEEQDPRFVDEALLEHQAEVPSYTGDRIVVSKFFYAFNEPERWDVVVFKNPGNAYQNYIKRLTGLPGETLRLQHGDIHVRPEGEPSFSIARKPPEKIFSLSQPVHDTYHESQRLITAGWPLRWQAWGNDAWSVESKPQGPAARPQYRLAQDDATELSWLRYQHLLPWQEDWRRLAKRDPQTFTADEIAGIKPHLITDFYGYNTKVRQEWVEANSMQPPGHVMGLHFVGDLMVTSDVEIESIGDGGELWLDLVEAGRRFSCRIDLSTGQATLGISALPEFAPTGNTPVKKAGSYEVSFANVDDQLVLWVNGQVIAFGEHAQGVPFDGDAVFTDGWFPVAGGLAEDGTPLPGDLAPAGVAARGATVTVDRLRLRRDVYYIGDGPKADSPPITELSRQSDAVVKTDGRGAGGIRGSVRAMRRLLTTPEAWEDYRRTVPIDFVLGPDQYFVMGDNSPFSQDARIWFREDNEPTPGGPYVEGRMMIGKAVFVFWPHSWNTIPGTGIPLPFFPNFADMRLIR